MDKQNQTLQLLTDLKKGQDELRTGQDKLWKGVDELRTGQDKLWKGQDELRTGLEDVRSGQDELRNDIKNIDGRLSRVDVAVVTLQVTTSNLDGRMARIEDVVDKTYSKLDGFIVLINRHEAELAALRNAIDRLTERMDRLEAHATG